MNRLDAISMIATEAMHRAWRTVQSLMVVPAPKPAYVYVTSQGCHLCRSNVMHTHRHPNPTVRSHRS